MCVHVRNGHLVGKLMGKEKMVVWSMVVVLLMLKCALASNHNAYSEHNGSTDNESHTGDELQDKFVRQIFSKYGQDGVLTVEGFENLLQSIGLRRMVAEVPIVRLNQNDTDERTTSSDGHAYPEGTSGIEMRRNKEIVEPDRTSRQNLGVSSIERHLLKSVTKNSSSLDSTILNEFDTTDSDNLGVESETWTSPTEAFSVEHCWTASDMLKNLQVSPKGPILPTHFLKMCPVIIHELGQLQCKGVHAEQESELEKPLADEEASSGMVWLYAASSVLIISLSGLLVVAVIPIMQGLFYQQLLQFLVALAVGSLTGDALLHLLPHALADNGQHMDGHVHHDHNDIHNHNHQISHQDIMVWKGLVAVIGILLFFMAERILTEISMRRKHAHVHLPSNMTILPQDDPELSRTVGEKLCKHKYGSYGYSYEEVAMDVLQGLNDTPCEDKDHHNCLEKSDQLEATDKQLLKPELSGVACAINNGKFAMNGGGDQAAVMVDSSKNRGVIITEHETQHHGHSHTHTHTVPASISAVAWMVIMGDGLHNFSDGLAIGAAFANSITGGLSTSIAVFCHELPHELGDFAVLLKSGMTAKQALAYNGLSSVLCFLGMLLGVALGNMASVTSWIFAGAAGMFIYIALVDMIPELNGTLTKQEDSSKIRICLQFLGMSLGVTIMLVIALYEHDLQDIINL